MAWTDSGARRHEILAGAGIGLASWALLTLAHLSGLLVPFDLRLLDLKFRLRGERPAVSSIALVGVDDETIRGYKGWPLPRDAYALLLAALEEGRAKAIGVDLQFPSDRNQHPEWNELLGHVTGGYANVIHSIWFHAQGPSRAPAENEDLPETVTRHGVSPVAVGVATASGVALPFDGLLNTAPHLGHVSVAVDQDGAIRRVPLFVRYGDRAYPALAVTLFGVQRGSKTGPSLHRRRGAAVIRWSDGPEIPVQLDAEGSTSIDFAGDRESFPNSYSMLDVLQWYRDGDLERLRATFEDRTVLVGLTSRQEASEDVGATPFAVATPLVYIHANLLDNLARGRFLTRPAGAVYLAGLAVVSLLAGILFASIPVPMGAIVAFVALLGTALGLQLALASGVEVPGVISLAILPLVYAGTGGYRYLFLTRRSRQREAEIREGMSVQQQFLPEAMIGRRLSRYRIDSRLGAGGMGVVYRATDMESGQEIALKILPAAELADEKLLRRFRHEAVALARLSHPHIARMIEFESQDGVHFIAMEFVRGESLLDRVKKGPLPESEAVSVASQVCDALTEAHARGILHRDLKPGNVMLSESGEVKLLDFGIARLTDVGGTMATVTGSMTESGQIVGTLAYMAPEVLRGERADERTDVYGVGVLLFEMLTGRRPFPDDTPHELMYMIVNQPPPRPSVLNGKVGAALERVVMEALAKNPSERPGSAVEMKRRLAGEFAGRTA